MEYRHEKVDAPNRCTEGCYSGVPRASFLGESIAWSASAAMRNGFNPRYPYRGRGIALDLSELNRGRGCARPKAFSTQAAIALPSVLLLDVCYRLPLHVERRISPTALQGINVVDHITRAGTFRHAS
jgi:hypothetical protein